VPGSRRGNAAVSRHYFIRQAATLLGLARKTADPKLTAALLGKAADYIAQADGMIPPPDQSPQPPDVETSQR
jgi:hypothetical protein